jgi:hypothetical protein|tara:strand:- start:227 stop:457 length:231 start_codon:yes stop_codon:yes gene_type:complete
MNNKQRLERLEELEKNFLDLQPRAAKTNIEKQLIRLVDEFLINKGNVRNDKDSAINGKKVRNNFIDKLLELYKENK